MMETHTDEDLAWPPGAVEAVDAAAWPDDEPVEPLG